MPEYVLFRQIRFLRENLLQVQQFGSARNPSSSVRDPSPSSSASSYSVKASPRTTTTINDLDDDCIRELFTKLSISELCKMRIVCKRFRLISEDILPFRWKSIDLSDRLKMGRSRSHKGYQLAQMRVLFKRYVITELTFSKGDFANVSDKRIINMISRYCPQLKSIHFIDFNFSTTDIGAENLKVFFNQLTSVFLERCSFANCKVAHVVSGNLGVLYSIYFQRIQTKYLVFPNAEKLIIRGGSIGRLLSKTTNQHTFFAKHRNVKHLEIGRLDLSIWRKCLPNLVVLKTAVLFSSSSSLADADLPRFDNLKDLTLNEVEDLSHSNIVTLLTAISARNVLERLEFGTMHIDIDYNMDSFVRAAGSCNSLKTLTIRAHCSNCADNLEQGVISYDFNEQ